MTTIRLITLAKSQDGRLFQHTSGKSETKLGRKKTVPQTVPHKNLEADLFHGTPMWQRPRLFSLCTWVANPFDPSK